MVIRFFLKFSTTYGQSVVLKYRKAIFGESHGFSILRMNYHSSEFWHAELETEANAPVEYHFCIEQGGNLQTDNWKNRLINPSNHDGRLMEVFDDWQAQAPCDQVFRSKAFQNNFEGDSNTIQANSDKNPTHYFNVHVSHLSGHKVVCLLGSVDKMKNWDTRHPLFLKKEKDIWSIGLDLSHEKNPLEYKFCIYDTQKKLVEYFEEGQNRSLSISSVDKVPKIYNHCPNFSRLSWRGAGVNVQLSSLKTKNSWGVGDFSDLNALTDWSAAAGIKMIQLLPINDTTATHTRKDSYPYSANSVFALHPVFLNIPALATFYGLEIPEAIIQRAESLNELPTMDYEAVAELKWEMIDSVYKKVKIEFENDSRFLNFFEENRYWLEPYAAFCHLRDKFKTADFSNWEDYCVYDRQKLLKLVDKKSKHYNKVAIHYFTQFHLHLQLSDAVSYSHNFNIILKGDLPIGVGRHSVDTWISPHLFHIDKQAGAPPDAFAKKGQNWSFPTYNWEAMKEDNYRWWGERMKHMSKYFDAIRIDHVLGFFRIWSIPLHAIEGIFGVFEPSVSLQVSDFSKKGISFDEQRYCQPFITDEILNNIFREKSDWVRKHVLSNGKIKEEFNTQSKVQAYSLKHSLDADIKIGLFDLLSNVILLKDSANSGEYHFRISMQDTSSFLHLPQSEQHLLNDLYTHYFFERQNSLWYQVAQNKLDIIQHSSDMMICAEDLGMVPDMVEGVLASRQMLALQVQRMPKRSYEDFSHPANAPYLSVVTPSTHDMSTIRQWWEEDRRVTQRFYNSLLGHNGEAPICCSSEICKEIIVQHLNSPAMWSVFLLQDLLSMDEKLRREDIHAERINVPANPDHYWNYRMHMNLETLIENNSFTETVKSVIVNSGRI